MAALGAQSIASSYEQLLHVDADGGGNGTTHVSLKDGDNGTTFPLTLATDAVMVTSTNRLEFGDNASYIHQSADGVLDLVSDTEIELTATTIDINGAAVFDGGAVFNEDSADVDFRVESNGDANMLFVDGGTDSIGIGTNAPNQYWPLHVYQGNAGTDPSWETTEARNLALFETDNSEGSISIFAPETATGLMYSFSEPGTRITGGMMYSNNTNTMTLQTNATDRLVIDGTGAAINASQPAFLARPGAAQNNIAIDTVVTIVLGTEVFDQGGDFASNTFTAPVTGRYQLNANVRVADLDSAADYYLLKIITHNRTYANVLMDPDFGQDAVYWNFQNSVLADMDASDTAYITLQQAGGTQQTDINVGDGETTFSGYLAC